MILVLDTATRRPVVGVAADDGKILGDFYEAIPAADVRFYCPHALTREKAMENAAAALNPYRVVLVVEAANGQIGGYAWFQWTDDRSPASTFGICIRRGFQGQGLGKMLMTRLLRIAQTDGPPVMSLTVQKANPRAIELYRSMDFEIVREQMRPARPEWNMESEPEYCMERRVR